MVTDEVDDRQRALALLNPQPPPQLLQKDGGRLRWPQHEHGIDVGNVEALIEEIDGEDHLEISAAEVVDRLMARSAGLPTVHRRAADTAFKEVGAHEVGMMLRCAKRQSAGTTAGLPLFECRLCALLGLNGG